MDLGIFNLWSVYMSLWNSPCSALSPSVSPLTNVWIKCRLPQGPEPTCTHAQGMRSSLWLLYNYSCICGNLVVSLNIVRYSISYLLKPLFEIYNFLLVSLYFILSLFFYMSSNFIAIVSDTISMFCDWLLLVNENTLFVHFSYIFVCKFLVGHLSDFLLFLILVVDSLGS